MISAWYLVIILSWHNDSFNILMATQQDCEVSANMIRDRANATAVCVPTGYGEKK